MVLNFPNTTKREALHMLFEVLNAINVEKDKRLAESEIHVLTEFLLLPEKFKYQRFSGLAKDYVIKSARENLGWKLTKENINNKLYFMIDKGVLYRDEDKVIYVSKWIQIVVERFLQDKTLAVVFESLLEEEDVQATSVQQSG